MPALTSSFHTRDGKHDRIGYLDAFKGMLICSVVLGHSLQANVHDFEGNLLVHAIYSFHMAAFMAISGFCSCRKGVPWEMSKVLRPLKRLLVPFFGWALVSWAVFSRTDLAGSLCSLLRHPDGGLWFLYVLAVCHLFLGIVRAMPVREEFSIVAGILFLVGLELATGWNEYGFHFIAWYFIFFAGGYLVRKSGLTPPRNAIFPVCCLATWCVLLPWWRRNTAISLPVVGEMPGIISFGYRFAVATLGIAGFWLMFRRTGAENAIFCRLRALGRETLGIYAVHGFVIAAAGFFKPDLAHSAEVAVSVAVMFALTLLASVAIARLVRKIPCIGHFMA